MKVIKGIGLFFIYPCIMLGIGFYAGMTMNNYFYPGNDAYKQEPESGQVLTIDTTETTDTSFLQSEPLLPESMVPVAAREEVISANTEYVVEEYDTKRDTLVETVWKIPAKYLGMDREAFLKAMELYALSPPLSEQQRGFVGLEVRSFSVSKVVVRMNYAYAEPSQSFYLRVEDNNIVVYCDDEETVYMYTNISAQALPEYIQTEIIMGMFIEDEAALYHFLETYSS